MNLVLLIGYTALLVGFSIFSYAFVDPNLFPLKKFYTGFTSENRDITTFLYILFIILFYLFYLIFLFKMRKRTLDTTFLKKLVPITIAILLFSYPAMLSYDIFNYMITAKVTFLYKENPYIVMPIEFLSDPNLAFTRAANKIALYGPSWILLTLIPFSLGLQNIIVTIFSFKLFITAFYIATVWLLWKLSRDTNSLALFVLNPLVIIETLVSAHNDIAMMFFALLAFYFTKKRNIFIGLIMLFVSILIKYATIVLLPVLLYAAYNAWQGRKISWDNVYLWAAISMFVVFLTAPLREEIYPWYVIWVLTFVSLISQKKFLLSFTIALSFGALLRYLPVLYTGSYFGQTPVVREIVTFVPIASVCLFFLYQKLVGSVVK